MPKEFYGYCTPDLVSVEYSTSNVEYYTLLQVISQNITINGYVRVQDISQNITINGYVRVQV